MNAKTEATKHDGMYQPPLDCPCWHTVSDAAAASGASAASIRRAAKRAGVVRIGGGYVAGMVEISACGRTGYMPFFC